MHKQAFPLRKQKKAVENDLLAEDFVYTGDRREEVQITLLRYNEQACSRQSLSPDDDFTAVFRPGKVNWLHVSGLSDTALVARIGKMLHLHPTDVQDILTAQHIAKIELYSDKTILVVDTFYDAGQKELQQEHICVILGKEYVVSFQESGLPLFDNVMNALSKNTALVRRQSADYLFFLLINNVLGNYLDVVAAFEDELEKMEDEVLTGEPGKDFGNRIQESRRNCLLLKKSVLPLKEDCSKMLHNGNNLIRDDNRVYLNDLEDRIGFIMQSIEMCRESVSSLIDLYFSDNALRMNGIMKQLTIVSTLFIPLTFVVGVWGMNFRVMPELKWTYGYLMAWIVMLVIAVVVWWLIRRQRWNR